ncbi:MAG: ferrous iron transport protein A [Oscillospiraceae bacterium]|nr:ferrous iron transport protein A [Oscillospiraceae bacterium]
MIPLIFADIGDEGIIKRVGGSPEIRRHLEELGFVAGGSVKIISAVGGNIIVKVKESRVAVDRALAEKIMI